MDRATHHGPSLARRLGAWDLTILGIGGTIGAGIFVLTGIVAAKQAGPAVTVSFVLSAVACALAGLSYAELASSIPAAGGSYSYAYATLGEIVAWMVGWDLVLEYTIGAITVAIGWSGYFVQLLSSIGITLPPHLTRPTLDGGLINLPAVALVLLIAGFVSVGIRESSRTTGVLVVAKVSIILFFIVIGIPRVEPHNWMPFMPYGAWGIVSGAGMAFYSYIGFETLTTTSEEMLNPQRDIPRSLFVSLAICAALYVSVAIVLTGMVPYHELNHPAPVAYALERAGITWGVTLIGVGTVVGLASVVFVNLIGQPRIFYAMGRDGLLPDWFCNVHARFRTPFQATLLTGGLAAAGAAIFPIEVAGEMTSIGTLFAFFIVCVAVIVRRKTHGHTGGFRVPGYPVIPIAGALVCLVLMAGLRSGTWVRFIVWMLLGLIIYAQYGYYYSRLRKPA